MKRFVPKYIIYSILLSFSLVICTIFIDRILVEINRPNVLLISVDALRADHLGCYGYKRHTSPYVDDVARSGTVFLHAVSTGAGTLPSLPSLVTSTYSFDHRVMNWHQTLESNAVTVAEVLKKNKVATAFICAHNFFPMTLENRKSKDWTFLKEYNAEKSLNNFFKINATRVLRDAKAWLKKNKGSPFFLWLHFMDTHAPYRPPSPYDQLYVNDAYYREGITAPLLKEYEWNAYGGIPRYMNLDNINVIDYYIAHYDGAITFVDHAIGELIRYLNRLNIAHRTVIIITADHGEGFGEHDYFGHDRCLYEEILHIPLIINIPWEHFVENKVPTLVESIDISPTILAIMKIKKPSMFRGESLMPLIEHRGAVRKKKIAFSSAAHGVSAASLQDNAWKLIRYENKYELYHLSRDPLERSNAVGTHPEKFMALKKNLENIESICYALGGRSERRLTSDELETLRSLGYLQ